MDPLEGKHLYNLVKENPGYVRTCEVDDWLDNDYVDRVDVDTTAPTKREEKKKKEKKRVDGRQSSERCSRLCSQF